MSDAKPQIQEIQRQPSRINVQKTTPQQMIFKMKKIKAKEKNLERIQTNKKLTYRGTN